MLSPEYEAIATAYAHRRAKRSGLPYMRHIDQGFLLLTEIMEPFDEDVLRAWLVHPLFQLDEFLTPMAADRAGVFGSVANSRVALLAMEYRAIANGYLPRNERTAPRWPKLSKIDAVNKMLIADKVQNYRDARLFLFGKIPSGQAKLLNDYFDSWLGALDVTGDALATYEHRLEADDAKRRKLNFYP